MISHVIEAFRQICDGYSADRVVLDPELNAQFIEKCRELGVESPVVDLNLKLLNERKRGNLGPTKDRKRTSFTNEEDYRFASEAAARHMEQRTGVALDRLLCDPELLPQFDEIAARITPGHSPLQYRWAALNLRKARKLRPEIVARVVKPRPLVLDFVDSLRLETVPSGQGVYIFFVDGRPLYVGEAANLRVRIRKHLDHSDIKSVARWFWEHGFDRVQVEILELPEGTTTRVRRALESELIRTRRPAMNLKL